MDDDAVFPDAVDSDGDEVESLDHMKELELEKDAPDSHTDGPEATDIIPPGVDEGEE